MGGGRGWEKRVHEAASPKKVLFMWGENKLFNFHQQAFVEKLGPNNAIPFPGGHWFFMPEEDGGACSAEDFEKALEHIKRHVAA